MQLKWIKDEVYGLRDQMVAWRRDFHKYPELGFEEQRTSGIIADALSELGIEVERGIAETGVVAHLIGNNPGPTVLLRFDMDALPIQELNDAEYASVHPGVMHACGHDAHMAIGLAVATILTRYHTELSGRVKFVFQPAEEILGGAQRMVEEGVLENPVPDFSLACHMWNEQPEGWFGISPGPLLAGAERFEVVIRGKGGHGATPHLSVDPVLASAQLITALQSVVSRNIDPRRSAVISVGQVSAGEAYNVIPEEVLLRGTIRTFEPEVRNMVIDRLNSITLQIASALGCEAKIEVETVAPPVVNEVELTQQVQEVAKALFPDADVDESIMSMVSEDMSLMMESNQGCYILVGSKDVENGIDAPHHNPYFDINEEALPRAATIITASAWRLLGNRGDH
jgi:amidohydrolase